MLRTDRHLAPILATELALLTAVDSDGNSSETGGSAHLPRGNRASHHSSRNPHPIHPYPSRQSSRLSHRRRPTSDRGMPAYSPPFPPCCAKSNTQTPNMRCLYSDLTLILPTKFDLFATVIGCTCVHPCPILVPPFFYK
jgi:hypothetical protein